jgi:transglutaminase-like putative cysteine protease
VAYTDRQPERGVEVSRVPRLAGYFGVLQTMARMAGIVREGSGHPLVALAARQFTRNGTHLDPRGRVENIRNRVGAAFEYVHDPAGVEQLSTPERLARAFRSHGTVRGDCDDLAIWTAAVGRTLRYPARFVALATGQHGRYLDHILTEWAVGDTWISMDTINPRARRLAVHVWRL